MYLAGTSQAPLQWGAGTQALSCSPLPASSSGEMFKKHKPGVSGAGKPECGTGVTQQAGEAGEGEGGKTRGGSEFHSRCRHRRVRKALEIKMSLGIFPGLWDGASAGAGQQTGPSQFPNVLHSSPSMTHQKILHGTQENAIHVFWQA